MSHEGHMGINGGECLKNDNMEEISKELEINENNDTDMGKELIERNERNEKKELAREDVCRLACNFSLLIVFDD